MSDDVMMPADAPPIGTQVQTAGGTQYLVTAVVKYIGNLGGHHNFVCNLRNAGNTYFPTGTVWKEGVTWYVEEYVPVRYPKSGVDF